MSKKLTVDEIKEKLDEKKIDYKSNMNRDELINLLNENPNEAEKETSEQDTDTPAEDNKVEKEEKPKQYIVIHDFKDLQDRNIVYIKDDFYPKRADSVISDERIQELMSDQNKIGVPLIKEQD